MPKMYRSIYLLRNLSLKYPKFWKKWPKLWTLHKCLVRLVQHNMWLSMVLFWLCFVCCVSSILDATCHSRGHNDWMLMIRYRSPPPQWSALAMSGFTYTFLLWELRFVSLTKCRCRVSANLYKTFVSMHSDLWPVLLTYGIN